MTYTVFAFAKFFLLVPLLSLTLLAARSLFLFWLRRQFINRLILLSSGNILNSVRLFLNRVWLLNLDVSILSLHESSGFGDLLNLYLLGKLDRLGSGSRATCSISCVSLCDSRG